MELGSKLREIRKNNKIGLNQLALSTGVSASQISRIENGKRSPKPDTLKKLAKGLHISDKYIFELAGITEKDQQSLDLADALDNHEYMTYQGKPIDDEDLELIKRILRNK